MVKSTFAAHHSLVFEVTFSPINNVNRTANSEAVHFQILPIENQMRHPGEMLGWFGVLNTSMLLVTCLYVAMGFYGFLRYGEFIQASITLNLPMDEALAKWVLGLFVFAVFVSYAIQFYVVMDILLRSVIVPRLGGRRRLAAEYATRVAVNLVSCEFFSAV